MTARLDSRGRRVRWAAPAERFAARVTEVAAPEGFDLPCWQWDVLRPDTGYGDFYDGRAWLAHRWSYEHHVGPIPEGLEIDHLCRNRGCVNPAHLEPVTPRENTHRGFGPSAQCARQTHCKRGHEFTDENTYRYPHGARACRTCKREHDRRYDAGRRSA